MFSPAPLVDSRGAAYARLASRVLETLSEAVERRNSEGTTRSEIANRIGCHRSQLSRVLNGAVSNLTLRTISDILWATDYEAQDFMADPVERLSANCPTHKDHEFDYNRTFSPKTVTIDFSEELGQMWLREPSRQHAVVEHAVS